MSLPDKILFRTLLSLILILLLSCSAPSQKSDKIDGFCLESPPMELEPKHFEEIQDTHAGWVAVIPYGYTRRGSSIVEYDSEFQWWGERYEGAAQIIADAQSKGMKVMLKPQVWIPGSWVGDFVPQEMESWKKSMTDFTLAWAHLADSMDVEIFCFATEFKALATQNPEYFSSLIDEIRKVYEGKVTYAANWDEYNMVDFWDKLDYIGVNAYFPLSDSEDPSTEELRASWNEISSNLNEATLQYKKDILFTEFGYRSAADAAKKPWEHGRADYEAVSQSKAFEALFSTVWNQPWLAGGFIWKWRFFEKAGGHGDASFTPQGKPAMKLIEKVYSNSSQ